MSDWFETFGFADILEGLVIGAYPLDEDDVAILAVKGVGRVFNLTQDDEYALGERERVERALAAAGIEEHRLPLVDYGNLPLALLEAAVREVIGSLDEGLTTYLHCRAGWQRSAAVAAGVVAVRDGTDVDKALQYVRLRRPSANPLPHQVEDLRRWWRFRG